MTTEAIAIPSKDLGHHTSIRHFAQFLHKGEVLAFALTPEDERRHNIRPYQTITIKIHDLQDQFCSVVSTNLAPC